MNANISSNRGSVESLSSAVAEPADAAQSAPPVGGITPFTTIDFPGRLAAVLYTQGCPWRCLYCHNRHLWPEQSNSLIPWENVLAFLESRAGFLEGVVFCGGEPTVHRGLGCAMEAAKRLGYQVALHTTGMFPDRLSGVLGLLDWVGMDIKAPFRIYEKITQAEPDPAAIRSSVRLILQSGVAHEFRTTVHPDLLSEREILEIALELHSLGVKNFVLQAFQPKGCPDARLNKSPIAAGLVSSPLRRSLGHLFRSFQVR